MAMPLWLSGLLQVVEQVTNEQVVPLLVKQMRRTADQALVAGPSDFVGLKLEGQTPCVLEGGTPPPLPSQSSIPAANASCLNPGADADAVADSVLRTVLWQTWDRRTFVSEDAMYWGPERPVVER